MTTFNCSSAATASVVGFVLGSVAGTAPEGEWRADGTEAGGPVAVPAELDSGSRETLCLSYPENANALREAIEDRESYVRMSVDELRDFLGLAEE